MAIPVHLQQFKAAGVYRVVFDKSTILNVDTEILRLVVGYSEIGPFNIPVYVNSPSDFKAIFGDISKKLEKRGVYFHRLALQALTVGPILCLNLKKFSGETVDAATISTAFNSRFNPIDTVKLKVEDIYDTTRFWELNADKLIGMRSTTGTVLDQYINLAITNTSTTSCSYFIRKAAGSKVAAYDLSVNTWYSDGIEQIPEFLENQKQNKISDYFAEIYVFKGKFTSKQVLASETLKKYFDITKDKDDNGDYIVKLKSNVKNAYGETIDTLDALYHDETSGALGHWVGALIPYFRNKQGGYASLDILFNSDIDIHNMMMSFNTDMLYEGETSIDLSGKLAICDNSHSASELHDGNHLFVRDIYNGVAKTTLLGNHKAPVIAEKIEFQTNAYDVKSGKPFLVFNSSNNKIGGTLYVETIPLGQMDYSLRLHQIGSDDVITIKANEDTFEDLKKVLDYEHTNFAAGSDVFTELNSLDGPKKLITGISRISKSTDEEGVYTDPEMDMKVNFIDVQIDSVNEVIGSVKNEKGEVEHVYSPSVSFINAGEWDYKADLVIDGIPHNVLYTDKIYDTSLMSIVSDGVCLLGANGSNPADPDDMFCDNIYASDPGTGMAKLDPESEELTPVNYIIVTGEPLRHIPVIGAEVVNSYYVILNSELNKETGVMTPVYFEGYTYKNAKPAGTDMRSKVEWQDLIMSALTEYKGLRAALLNKSEIDYRYVVDTFESYPISNLKSQLTYLCKEKQSALCICNFPSVQTFVKCPYTSFTDAHGLFNVKYIVEGGNKKKVSSIKFSLPSDGDGASFGAFYTPLKFSDGYIDSIIPSAGLVSNLFMQKYLSRKPYYIVAGPNYGNIYASGLVGPDYKYTMDELQIIEPFGVNCMVYRPNFGTFINANQTAKQIPLSALSKVNVRELVIYLQDEIEKVLQAYQWEFNNSATRNAILTKANLICEMIKINGGLQTYKNIMDESNNTPEIIDNEMAVLSTHIEPGLGCGKMVHELTLYRTGQMKSSILD